LSFVATGREAVAGGALELDADDNPSPLSR
jgi:hypothetical protein